MITAEVDLSARLGAVRDQGPRPTCLIFAGSDLNAAANGVEHLSAEFLCHHAAKLAGDWQPGRGFQMDHVLGAVHAPGQPLEQFYPYQRECDDAPLTAPTGEMVLYSSPAARRLDLTSADVLTYLHGGKPVGLIIQVCQALMTPKNGVIEFDPLVLPDQYHALIGVGVGKSVEADEEFVLLRNSWGDSWGNVGHAWMSITLLDLLLVEGFMI